MKRTIALLLALLLCLSLCACGGLEAVEGSLNGDYQLQHNTGVLWLTDCPEAESLLQSLAQRYTAQTGTPVAIRAVAAEDYAAQLQAELSGASAPTMFFVTEDTRSALQEYCLNLADSGLYTQLRNKGLSLSEDGYVYAVGTWFSSVGLIVNMDLLEKAGYSAEDLSDLALFYTAVKNIHSRAAELGFDAFAPNILADAEEGLLAALAALPESYSSSAVILQDLCELIRENSPADGSGMESFIAGQAVFTLGTDADRVTIHAANEEGSYSFRTIPCGFAGEMENSLPLQLRYVALNRTEDLSTIRAGESFLLWLEIDEEASAAMNAMFGGCANADAPMNTNSFSQTVCDELSEGKKPLLITPKTSAAEALRAYGAGTGSWAEVEAALAD